MMTPTRHSRSTMVLSDLDDVALFYYLGDNFLLNVTHNSLILKVLRKKVLKNLEIWRIMLTFASLKRNKEAYSPSLRTGSELSTSGPVNFYGGLAIVITLLFILSQYLVEHFLVDHFSTEKFRQDRFCRKSDRS